ncbi:MAG: 3-oxoacyl-ACP reductase FabG [Bacteroidales bacterium]|nr:3-oxoacyl-ACP reductase FabG [Bacteroidales bacterium]
METKAKYALVTGGSRGIGKAICIRLAQDGFKVIINYVSNTAEAENTLAAVQAAGSEGEILRFNVADAQATQDAISGWQAAHPGEYISVLVNCAGIRKDNLMIMMPEDDWHKVLDIALNGFYNCTKACVRDMITKRYGRIINIASLSGLKGVPGQTNYSAAKGGIIAATKALAQEIAKRKVTVNAVAPGFIHSDMTSELPEAELAKMIPMGRFGEPEEVADLVSFLASDRAAYITGEVININGGLYS